MARPRKELSTILKGIIKNVYYMPPANIKMEYPCIRYRLVRDRAFFGDNKRLLSFNTYELTLIDLEPDSVYIDPILELEYCSREPGGEYMSDGLYHNVFRIFF